MIRFILIRLAQSVPVLLAIYTITFFMVKAAPGSPFSQERNLPESVLEAQRAYYGYGDPWHVQYASLLLKHITLDLPPLPSNPGLTSLDIIREAFPNSLQLGLLALLIALAVGVPAGVAAAARKNSVLDYASMSAAMVGICLPSFVLGPLLALTFGLWLGWFNTSGWFTWSDRVLPASALGLYYAAYIARLTRSGMLEVLNLDYIRTARAKGASEKAVVFKHALRGGIVPVVAYLGPALAGLITGSFVVETIFQIPGLGRHFIQAALNRDLSLILSTVLFYAVIIIIANLLVDLAQVSLNPRLKHQ